MKISINIQTQKESNSYYETIINNKGKEENKYVTKDLNPLDKDNQAQAIQMTLSDFNYTGSLQPLMELITDWVNSKMQPPKEVGFESFIKASKIKP